MKTLYDLLGVGSDADDDSIEKAYRQAIKAYHPDLHGGDPQFASLFQDIVAAADVLRDPNQRAAYDLKLRHERKRRRERAAVAILCEVAVAIISFGLVSGRLIVFSGSATTLLESAPSVAASELPPNEVVDRKDLPFESSVESTAAPFASLESPQRQLEASEIALLMKRGEELLATGNIGAARSMFQLAAEAGDPAAASALAQTYDPSVLGKLGAKGITPDVALAQRWYEKAKVLGSITAADDW